MFPNPKQYFKMLGLSPRKRYGQHFLADTAIARHIVESAEIGGHDVAVEIGPGLGALTQHATRRAQRLHLVEVDRDLAELLASCLGDAGAAAEVHRQDVLDFDFTAMSRAEGRRLVVLGNLPYNISSPLVFRFLDHADALDRAVVMLQKEVGDRLTAAPGTKEYGVLSVLLPAFADVRMLFKVGPGAFRPQPKVDSVVLRIDFKEEPLVSPSQYEFLKLVVNTAFQKRRKTLRNSLKALPGEADESLQTAFLESSIDPGRRPETLDTGEFIRLAQELRVRHESARV